MEQPRVLFNYIGMLPESPVWDADSQSLFWADILKGEIHRYQPDTGEHQRWQFPEEVGCFALFEHGGFIVALRSAIWLADEQGQLNHKVCDNPSNPRLARFNDGGTDRAGRFYAGTFWAPGDYNGALLVQIDNHLRPRVIQHDIHGANGLAFSPDNRLMYTSDTPNGVIYHTPLSPDGKPGERTVFRRFKSGEGIPDGAAVDSEGCYWSAMYDGYRVARFSPQGEQIAEINLPVRCPTMVCFGGPALKTLYITTTRENMDTQELAQRPLSGAIFTLELDVAGLPATKFSAPWG